MLEEPYPNLKAFLESFSAMNVSVQDFGNLLDAVAAAPPELDSGRVLRVRKYPLFQLQADACK